MRELVEQAAALPASFSILSTLRFVGGAKGHGLPGAWFVEALGALGVPPATVRQALYRLEHQHVLRTVKVGRSKIYLPRAAGEAALEVGTEKLFRVRTVERWDGLWTLVHLQISPERSYERNRILDVLRVEGFAPLADGVFLHPRERSRHVADAARDLGVADEVLIFRAHRVDDAPARRMAALWDLAAVRLKYHRFLARFEPFIRESKRADGVHAFAGRLLAVHEFLTAAWDDPDLPREILPEDWPADRARRVIQTLYQRWRRGAMAFADEILSAVTGRNKLATELSRSGAKRARAAIGGDRRSPVPPTSRAIVNRSRRALVAGRSIAEKRETPPTTGPSS